MRESLVPRWVLLLLLAVALVLLVATVVALALGLLLSALGDAAGSAALNYVAVACGGLLATDLVCLVLAQAVKMLADADEPPDAK